MSSKLISQLDPNGYYVGSVMADESPLEPGVYHIPAGAVDATPPSIPFGKAALFENNRFVIVDIPTPPAPIEQTPPPLTAEQQEAFLKSTAAPPLTPEQEKEFIGGVSVAELSLAEQRALCYAKEADPLFFKAQRGEATMEQWKAKIEEIKARFPGTPVAPVPPSGPADPAKPSNPVLAESETPAPAVT